MKHPNYSQQKCSSIVKFMCVESKEKLERGYTIKEEENKRKSRTKKKLNKFKTSFWLNTNMTIRTANEK